jgi:DNA-binding GntR family transcriptional regulator
VSPEIERPEPPYMQVVRHIREQIQDGRLPEGSTIPSARQITKDWGISLATATKVLAALRSEGLVRAVVGIGTVVLAPTPSPQGHLVSMHQTGRIYPQGNYARILGSELVPAPDNVAEALGVAPGTPVIRRHRVTFRGENPLSASTSWFDGSLAETAPLLLVAERLKQGTPRYVQEMTGRKVVRGRDDIKARIVSSEEAEELNIEPGTAVLQGANTYIDGEGDVIEFGEYVAPGDLGWSYEYQVSE